MPLSHITSLLVFPIKNSLKKQKHKERPQKPFTFL